MADSNILKIPLLSTSQSGKETTINTMISYLERSMNDAQTVNFGGGNATLTPTDLARFFMFKFAGTGASSTLNITAAKRMFLVDNISSANDVDISCGTDTTTIPAGAICLVHCDGTNLINATDSTVMGGGGVPTTFAALTDTPNSYADSGFFVLRVKEDLTGVEFHALGLVDLVDVDTDTILDGQVLAWDDGTSTFVPVDLPEGGGGGEETNLAYKAAVAVASTGPIDLSTELVNLSAMDGIGLETGMRVLIKDQVDPNENGIYLVAAAGAAARATDANEDAEFPFGCVVPVVFGDVNGLAFFIQTEETVVVGSSPINFSTRSDALTLGSLSDVNTSDSPPTDGQVLVWNEADSEWQPGDSSGSASTTIEIAEVTGSHTLLITDAGKYIRIDTASANNLTVPPEGTVAFSIGTIIQLRQVGTGQTTVVAGSGVTITTAETLNLRKQGSSASLIKVASDTWDLTGDLELV